MKAHAIVLLVIVVFVGYLVYRHFKKKDENGKPVNTAPVDSNEEEKYEVVNEGSSLPATGNDEDHKGVLNIDSLEDGATIEKEVKKSVKTDPEKESVKIDKSNLL